MGSLYNPQQATSYIMEVDKNNLTNWAISQVMHDVDFEWVTDDKCRNLEQLMIYADGRIAIFNTKLLDYQENEKDKKYNIFKVYFEYHLELHERNNNCALAPEIISIEPKITGKKQHTLRAQYFAAA